MSQSKTSNKTHDAAVVTADSTLQSAIAVATTQAAANTACIAYYRSVLASDIANGLDAAPAIFALKTLGATV